jgi:hypothetical protein
MEELDNQRCKLQESVDEVTRLKQLISAKDATIKELRASKKSIVQELETARLAAKAAEETSVTLRAQRDRAMDKAIRAGRILMRRLLGRRQRRHPSLEVFAAAAGLTETKQVGTPFADSAPDEDLRRSHPTVRPRPAQRPACDPTHCNEPCMAAVCYGPNL